MTTAPERPRWMDYLPLDDLVGAERNPKNHHGDLSASMRRFGYVEAITLDERTGRLVAGHGRVDDLRAKLAAGEPPPEGVTVDEEGRWVVPVQRGWASTDDGQAEAYLIASNQIVIAGGWNEDELARLTDDLAALDVDLSGIGLSDPETIHVAGHERKPAEPKEPDQVTQRVAPGDVWTLGPHRLGCGSCTDPAAVAAMLDGREPSMLVTDPPYSSGGWQEAGRAAGSIGTTRTIDGERQTQIPQIANDRLSTRGYQALMTAAFNACPVPAIYVFTDWRMWVNLFDVAEAAGYGVRAMIVWDKGSPGMGRGWRSQHELILHAAKAPIEFDKHAAVGNVIGLPRTGNPLHPTQKPVELIEKLIANTPGSTVYDPFAGSGTTLIAAEQQGRACFTMELDPGYCDVILDRWERHGGAAPEKVTP